MNQLVNDSGSATVVVDSGRRAFMGQVATSVGGLSLVSSLSGCISSGPKNAWVVAETIRKTVVPPVFPDRIIDIRSFGADANSADNTAAIAAAILACHQQGGGTVLVKGGQYKCGPIHLLSNINLHIDESATLLFSTDPAAYLPPVFTRWEGMELMGSSPLIYAYQQTNIAITGKGALNGQADEVHWWPWKGRVKDGKDWSDPDTPTQDMARTQLQIEVENNLPVEKRIYAENAYLRPPFVQLYQCKNILIKDVTITNSPFWLIHPVLSENVTIDGVTCVSHGPNSDGCDPESCKNVVIKNCVFDTGDDCIAIKSGRNADGRRVNIPSENIVISDCKMRKGHGGVVIGSEISGGVRNVFVEDCQMSSPDLERGIRIKTNSVRGGIIEKIYVRDIQIGEVQTAIVIDFNYEEGDTGQFTPIVRDVEISNLICEKAKQVFQVRGYSRSPIINLRLNNCIFKQVETIGILEELENFSANQVVIQGIPFSVGAT